MERKQELKILINNIKSKLYNRYNLFWLQDVEEFIKHYDEINNLQITLNKYIDEYNSLN